VSQPWATRPVAIVLPIVVARALFERATGRRPNEDDVIAYINLWRPSRSGAPTPPAGGFWLRWRHPDDESATIELLQWDPDLLGPRGDEQILAVVQNLAREEE
jgi:hypothetical protein